MQTIKIIQSHLVADWRQVITAAETHAEIIAALNLIPGD
jgi:hypothetical protein